MHIDCFQPSHEYSNVMSYPARSPMYMSMHNSDGCTSGIVNNHIRIDFGLSHPDDVNSYSLNKIYEPRMNETICGFLHKIFKNICSIKYLLFYSMGTKE
jgi:hypothetical protein